MSSINNLRNKLAKKAFETGVLYMKMEEYDSAKLSFQIILDKFYDTSFLAPSIKEMAIALAKNREFEDASSFLLSNKENLTENHLYDEANSAVDQIRSKLLKQQ